jgi:hypothetical protein
MFAVLICSNASFQDGKSLLVKSLVAWVKSILWFFLAFDFLSPVVNIFSTIHQNSYCLRIKILSLTYKIK